MNIVNISRSLVTLAIILGVSIVAFGPTDTAQALTRAQQQACQDKWAGNYLADSAKVTNYRKSNCPTSKGGNCTSTNHRVPAPDGGGEEIRTTIACPVGGGGGGDTPDDTPGGGTTSTSCNGVDTSIDWGCSSGGSSPVLGMLLQVINFLAVGVGIAVVGGIVWGGMIYASSNGDAGKTKQAITVIVNAIVGLLLFIFAYALINYLVPGGFLNASIPVAPPPTNNPGSGNGNGGDSDPPAPVSVGDIRLRNFRDASTTSGGSVLKEGVLFRSVQLKDLSTQDAKKLSQLLDGRDGTIIDIRSASQRADAPDKDVPNVRKVNVSITGFLDTTPAVTDAATRRAFGIALRSAANANGPVLVHCVAGKDRTGWMVAMIMYAAGANNSQVMTEYMKSTDANFVVKQAWLNNGLSAARNRYGSIPGYLKRGLGLSDSDIKKLRQKFGA